MAEVAAESNLEKFLKRRLWRLRNRRALRAAHRVALADAQEVYERYRGQSVVMSQGEGPGYSFVSAASPGREAWDSYFDAMLEQGFSAWDTQRWFDRELKR